MSAAKSSLWFEVSMLSVILIVSLVAATVEQMTAARSPKALAAAPAQQSQPLDARRR